MATARTAQKPVISVIMANYNCEAYLAGAIRSVLGQSLQEIEIILVDDGSTDNSVKIARELAKADKRLRVYSGKRLGGPAPVRNFALDKAKGDWIAIVDSDDLILPDRLERMLTAAVTRKADILIDNLAIFQSDGSPGIATMFEGDLKTTPASVMESEYIRANALFGTGTKLGYAKPIIRRSALDAHDVRYNEAMRIGEDYDLIVRMLSAGCRLLTIPDAMYFYRKHDQSISHRLDTESLMALKTAAEDALGRPTPHAEVTAAHAARLNSIQRAISYDTVIRSLKEKQVFRAIGLLRDNPSVLPLLRLPVMDRIKTGLGQYLPHQSEPQLESQLAQLRTECGA